MDRNETINRRGGCIYALHALVSSLRMVHCRPARDLLHWPKSGRRCRLSQIDAEDAAVEPSRDRQPGCIAVEECRGWVEVIEWPSLLPVPIMGEAG